MSREGDCEICVVSSCMLYAASSDSRVVKQLGASDHSLHWHWHWHPCIAFVPWLVLCVDCQMLTVLDLIGPGHVTCVASVGRLNVNDQHSDSNDSHTYIRTQMMYCTVIISAIL